MTTDQRHNHILNPREAAAYIGVSPVTLAGWRSNLRVQIPYMKIGRKVVYRTSDLESFLASVRVDDRDPAPER